MRNFKSVALLSLLIAAALFLGGFRLGKYIERIDKSYVPPFSPTPLLPTPTPSSPKIQIQAFRHEGCGVEFIDAASLVGTAISSDEALLQKDKERIYLTCAKNARQLFINVKDKESTATARVQGQNVTVVKSKRNFYFTLFNPKQAKTVYFEVTESLKDLLLKTLSFN